MTDRQRNKDLKEFSELLKQEIAKQGHYDKEINVITKIEIDRISSELDSTIRAVNFTATYYNDMVIDAAVALAAKALVLASNAKRELDAWEAARA